MTNKQKHNKHSHKNDQKQNCYYGIHIKIFIYHFENNEILSFYYLFEIVRKSLL